MQNSLRPLSKPWIPCSHRFASSWRRVTARCVASGSNPPPVNIHTGLSASIKPETPFVREAVAPDEADNWISHMEKDLRRHLLCCYPRITSGGPGYYPMDNTTSALELSFNASLSKLICRYYLTSIVIEICVVIGTDSEYFVFVFELSVRIFRPFSKDILSFHDSSPELLCFPIFMSFAMILYMFDFKTYSIARAIYTHDHDLHDLPPSHGGAYGCILMVNTRTDAELAAAVQAAVDAMLPQIREQVREEYRTGAVTSVAPVDAENWISHMEKIFDVMDCNDAFKTRLAVYKFEGDALAWWKAYKQAKGGDVWVLTLTWAAFKELFFLQFFPRAEQERLKREYHSIRQRASENSTEYMQRFLRLAGFLGQAAGTAEEQAKNFRWGLHKSILDHVMCIQFTDVAQVADAARNLEILRDRDDYDRSERSDKRHKSGDRYQPDTQQNNYRSHDQKNDRHGSNRQGGGGNNNNNNNNNNNYSSGNNRSSGAGHDQRNRGQQFHRSTSSDSQQSRVPSEGYTHPVCATCGRRHPGECRRASGTCFKCGQAGHLQRDCKKNIGAGTSGHANNTQDQAANTSGTITGTLFIFGRAVFVLFDTGATHSVISTTFASCFTMTPVLLDHVLCISTPLKDSARITHVYGDLPLQFDDKIRSVNALPLDMCEFDMILGIDWLAVHRASVDCHSRRVIFGDIHAPEFIYQGSLPGKSMSCPAMNPRWASRITGRFLEAEDTESTPQAIAPERTVKFNPPVIQTNETPREAASLIRVIAKERDTSPYLIIVPLLALFRFLIGISDFEELYDRIIAVVEYGSGCSENKMVSPTFGFLGPQSDYDGHGWPQTSGHCWTNQVQQRDYEIAMDHYIRMAIGNAPWPIGETMVGIHERSAREKIYTNSVAHVMNDETTRKYLQSVKRLMTFCERRYPTMPSKAGGSIA
ncbi:putative reverse transcriptase domain-containing protein [Tanacetum coccineum]